MGFPSQCSLHFYSLLESLLKLLPNVSSPISKLIKWDARETQVFSPNEVAEENLSSELRLVGQGYSDQFPS